MSLIKKAVFKLGATVLGSRLYKRLNFSHDDSSEAYLDDQVKLLKNHQVEYIFDVGARYGQISAEYKRVFPKAKVHAFEPFTESFETLKKQTEKVEGIELHNKAVGSAEGELTLRENKFNAANSMLESDESHTVIDDLTKTVNEHTVSVITLDEFASQNHIGHIDILKMDIQGYELEALKGATDLLARKAISLIYTEVLFMPIYKNQPFFHDIAQFLEKQGYYLYNIYNPWYTEGRLSWADALFVSKSIDEK